MIKRYNIIHRIKYSLRDLDLLFDVNNYAWPILSSDSCHIQSKWCQRSPWHQLDLAVNSIPKPSIRWILVAGAVRASPTSHRRRHSRLHLRAVNCVCSDQLLPPTSSAPSELCRTSNVQAIHSRRAYWSPMTTRWRRFWLNCSTDRCLLARFRLHSRQLMWHTDTVTEEVWSRPSQCSVVSTDRQLIGPFKAAWTSGRSAASRSP